MGPGAWEKDLMVHIIALSYCWLTKAHPDPEGEQLRSLVAAIEARQSVPALRKFYKLAFFIDWCSLYQEPRSSHQHISMGRALKTMHVWYAHRQVCTWMLTKTPDSVLAYEERGWTT